MYSLCFLSPTTGQWTTNWHEYFDLNDIDFEKVAQFVEQGGYLAFGYMHGKKHSRNLTANRCRTILWERLAPKPQIQPIKVPNQTFRTKKFLKMGGEG